VSSLLLSSSFAHALPLLLLVSCRPPHPGPPSPASSSHSLPDCRLLELHPAPVHLYDPSSSSPDSPFGPSPPLLPSRRAPSRTVYSSLSSAESTTPRAPRHRVFRPPNALTQTVTPTPACRCLFLTADPLHYGQASPMSFFLPVTPKMVHHPTALLPGPSPLHRIPGTTRIRSGHRRPAPWEQASLPLGLGPSPLLQWHSSITFRIIQIHF
jgi:hypothetical protein